MMEYDFFDNNGEEKDVQHAPAPRPMMENLPIRRKKKVSWGKIILGIFLAAVCFGCGALTTWASLDPELRTLLKLKEKVQDKYYQEITDEQFYKAIFGGINDDLLDPYSGYMTPEEFAASISDLEGNRIGVGLVFGVQDEAELLITRVCGNSPAEAAGILAGDRIIGLGATETQITPCATFDEFSKFLEGYGEREFFYLQLQAGGTTRVVKTCKDAYVEGYVFYRTATSSYCFTGDSAEEWTEKGLPLICLDNQTAYIRLVQFTGTASYEFGVAMERFQEDGMKNLVLDLRSNGGGYLDTMQAIAGYFCKNSEASQPVVAVADYGNTRKTFKANGNGYGNFFAEDSRIIVLADRYSASASECLIGCMLDYGTITFADICLAERGGVAKTYGKGIMQETFFINLLKQDAITLTTAEIRWPVSDRSIHGRGILPEDGAKTIAENYDYETETVNAITAMLGS